MEAETKAWLSTHVGELLKSSLVSSPVVAEVAVHFTPLLVSVLLRLRLINVCSTSQNKLCRKNFLDSPSCGPAVFFVPVRTPSWSVHLNMKCSLMCACMCERERLSKTPCISSAAISTHTSSSECVIDFSDLFFLTLQPLQA